MIIVNGSQICWFKIARKLDIHYWTWHKTDQFMGHMKYFWQGACASDSIPCKQMLRWKQLWFDSRKRRLRLSPQLYWCTHRVTWPVKTPQGSEDPPPFHSICKKRKLGQCADQLCRRWRWFYILVWFVKAGASAFQHKIHTRVTSLRPTVCCTEERFTFHSQRWALQAKNCTTLIKFEFEVVIWVCPPPPKYRG